MPFSHFRGGLSRLYTVAAGLSRQSGFPPPAQFVRLEWGCGTCGALRMLFSHTLWSPAADQRLLLLRMFALGRNSRPPTSRTVHSHIQPPASSLQLPASRTVCPHNEPPASSFQLPASRTPKPFGIYSYEKRAGKSLRIHSCKIVGLKLPWNQHLQKKWVGAPSLPPCFRASLPQPGFSYSRRRGSPCPQNSS